MKNIATLVILLLPNLSLASSAMDPCVEFWPNGVESGEVSINYLISEKCEIVGINIIKSVPNGLFNQMAFCEIKRSSPIAPKGSNIKVLSQKEYNEAIEAHKFNNPDKIHSRQLLVTSSNSNKVALTCYFNERWELTSHEINNGTEVIAVNQKYIQELPIQTYEKKFTLEL